MPILLDFSGTVFSSVYVAVSSEKDTSLEYMRHLIINQIRSTHKKFSKKYGELILCLDSSNGYWRKDIFPYYKAKRKEAREANTAIDWNEVFSNVHQVIDEIRENLPYKVIKIPKCEADDIVGTLSRLQPWNTSEDFFGISKKEPTLIVSNDHDFKQLHKYDNVFQYFPKHAKIMAEPDPVYYLCEHILKGDPGDGIPNVLSDPDTFMDDNKRQKPLSKKKIINIYTTKEIPDDIKKRYEVNKTLIDLSLTPEELVESIISEYTNIKTQQNRMKLMMYLTKYSLDMQLQHIEDF